VDYPGKQETLKEFDELIKKEKESGERLKALLEKQNEHYASLLSGMKKGIIKNAGVIKNAVDKLVENHK